MENNINDKLKSKKEYYFRQYFNKSDLIRERREIIEELNLTKKEIKENPIYIGAVNYDSMPHNPNVNPDVVLDKIIKTDDKIENIDNKIIKQMQMLDRDMAIFEKIDIMRQEFNDSQSKVFELTYRDRLRRVEVAYEIGLTERAVQYIKQEIFKKADFIQED